MDKNGETMTVHSLSAGAEDGTEVLVTPILPNGQVMDDGWAEDLAASYAEGKITLKTELVGEDGKKLGYEFKDIYMGTYESAEAANEAATAYHDLHEAVMEASDAFDGLNGTMSNTSTLM